MLPVLGQKSIQHIRQPGRYVKHIKGRREHRTEQQNDTGSHSEKRYCVCQITFIHLSMECRKRDLSLCPMACNGDMVAVGFRNRQNEVRIHNVNAFSVSAISCSISGRILSLYFDKSAL